jgi:DNA polymerase III epsilon subunit-like protein
MIATVFDNETTHLIDNHVVKLASQPYVIEFYGCHVNLATGQVYKELEHLIRPPEKKDIDEKIAEKSHGITWDLVRDKPQFSEVADEIFTFLSRADAVLAHNLSFDIEMMDIEAERLGKKIFWPDKKICTLEQTTWVKGSWLNLSDLHEHLFGMKFDGSHRAKNDTLALTRCAVEMYYRGWIG